MSDVWSAQVYAQKQQVARFVTLKGKSDTYREIGEELMNEQVTRVLVFKNDVLHQTIIVVPEEKSK
jgi:hypothetical protein